VEHFLSLHAHAATVTVGHPAMEALKAYDWPGNVRQLLRVIERALALASSSCIGLADLPEQISTDARSARLEGAVVEDSLRAWSSRYVRMVLERCQGNKRRACDILDISYHTLQSHLDYGARPSRRRRLPVVAHAVETTTGAV
jgi:DNA-binding NtrC family response regulator